MDSVLTDMARVGFKPAAESKKGGKAKSFGFLLFLFLTIRTPLVYGGLHEAMRRLIYQLEIHTHGQVVTIASPITHAVISAKRLHPSIPLVFNQEERQLNDLRP